MRHVIKVCGGGEISDIDVGDEKLSEKFIKDNIGISDGRSWFERVRFPGIGEVDIICDEEGKLKSLKPSLLFENDYIAGDCLIVSIEYDDEGEFAWFGLSEEQSAAVIERIVF
ncbi:MAG: DUF3846 domain-containing protein [Komarekiella atlantica HA4396-MV6]|nr:DUF3846 domain-containing protein [Komarekiella atlantica HA4396-MV6]